MSPSPPLRAVLFDWDGTLVDSAEATFRSYVGLFAGYGIAYDRDLFASTYSPDWYKTYEALALDRDLWSEADDRWIELYGREEVRLLPGAFSALGRLRATNLLTALVTSGSRPRVERELSALGIAELLDLLVCCEDVSAKKPDPAPLRTALERLRVPPEAAAYVGDSPEDVRMSRAAGVYVVAVEGGFPNREALRASDPDLMARDLEGAVEALLGRNGERPS